MKKNRLSQFFSGLIFFTLVLDCYALPKDPQVASGVAKIDQLDPYNMEIHPSDQAIINYSKFDIGTNPSSTSRSYI